MRKLLFLGLLVFTALTVFASNNNHVTDEINRAKSKAVESGKFVFAYFVTDDDKCNNFSDYTLGDSKVQHFIHDNCERIIVHTDYNSFGALANKYGVKQLPAIVMINVDESFKQIELKKFTSKYLLDALQSHKSDYYSQFFTTRSGINDPLNDIKYFKEELEISAEDLEIEEEEVVVTLIETYNADSKEEYDLIANEEIIQIGIYSSEQNAMKKVKKVRLKVGKSATIIKHKGEWLVYFNKNEFSSIATKMKKNKIDYISTKM